MVSILVVEDDAKLNQIVSSTLQKNGYHVISCAAGLEGYDAMVDNMVDIILSDVMIPGIDGFEFTESVRVLDKSIHILFMTAPGVR